MLGTKPRNAPGVDRRVLHGIFWAPRGIFQTSKVLQSFRAGELASRTRSAVFLCEDEEVPPLGTSCRPPSFLRSPYLTSIQRSEGPERYGPSTRFETMPSAPI